MFYSDGWCQRIDQENRALRLLPAADLVEVIIWGYTKPQLQRCLLGSATSRGAAIGCGLAEGESLLAYRQRFLRNL